MEADGAVDAQNAPTAPWKTLCVFHELPQGLSHQVTHEKLRKAPKYRWETRIDPSFRYQAKSWTTPRRIVAKVEHHRGELFPRVGFIVTNMVLPSRSVVRFYNKRGTAEQWIKEGKQATHWTRLSCHRFRANEVRLQLSVLAYSLGNLWRRLVLPPRIKRWSLTSLQHRLVKTGGRLVKHARYYWLLLAEGHLTRRLFGDMLRRIWALPVPGG